MQHLFDIRPLIIPACLTLLSACGDHSKDGTPAAATAAAVQDTAQVFLLRSDTVNKAVELPSELLPYLQTDLFAKVQGYVREMKVDIGDRVRKGQTLAILEAPEVNTQVTQSEAALQSARAKYTEIGRAHV